MVRGIRRGESRLGPRASATCRAVVGLGLAVSSACSARVAEQETLRNTSVAASERAETDRTHVRELETRLALSEARARELEQQARARPSFARETVRIGGGVGDDGFAYFDTEGTVIAPQEESAVASEPPPDNAGGRPLLRLYGEPQVDASALPAIAPRDYPGVPPIPLTPQTSTPPFLTNAAPAADSGPRLAYRSGLQLLRSGSLDEAAARFREVVERFPESGEAADAKYWTAEVLYVQRRYRDALRGFQAVYAANPRSGRAADALLKIGLCHRRMGDVASENEALRRLETNYPESAAARSVAGMP